MENRPEMKLWEPANCCCFKLRAGSILIGISFTVGGCLGAILMVLHLLNLDETLKQGCKADYIPQLCIEDHYGREMGVTITFLVSSCFHCIYGVILLFGILKQKTAVFVPLMMMYAMQIGLWIVLTIGSIFALLLYFRVHFMFILLFGGVFGMIIYIMSYFLLVIRAHFYEIKRVKGDLHVALDEQNVEAATNPQSEPLPSHSGQDPPAYSIT